MTFYVFWVVAHVFSNTGCNWSTLLSRWTGLVYLVWRIDLLSWSVQPSSYELDEALARYDGPVRHRQSKEAIAYYGHTMRKQGSCLKKEIMQGTMPGGRRRGRPRTAWMENIKTWTVLPVEESIWMTADRDKWRKYVHAVANPRIEDG